MIVPRREDHYARSIFSVCEELHMSRTGSSDALRDDERFARIEWLKYRLLSWSDSPPFTFQYDECVRMLVKTTLADEGVML